MTRYQLDRESDIAWLARWVFRLLMLGGLVWVVVWGPGPVQRWGRFRAHPRLKP